jgi:two-component system, OmpR family, response regulator
MKALVVEDEKKIASFVSQGLEERGFVVDVCHRGDDAFELASSRRYDVVLLDIMLPGRDGLSILRGLRDRKNTVPIILLTARGQLNERVEGLNLGADDYVAKPFFLDELLARVHAVLRRASGEEMSLLQAGDLTVNLITREVHRAGVSVELSNREFALLTCLMSSAGRVYTRTQLCEHVWNYHHDPGTNLVDVYIQRVRKKIGDDPAAPLIETVRGVGYRFRKG